MAAKNGGLKNGRRDNYFDKRRKCSLLTVSLRLTAAMSKAGPLVSVCMLLSVSGASMTAEKVDGHGLFSRNDWAAVLIHSNTPSL